MVTVRAAGNWGAPAFAAVIHATRVILQLPTGGAGKGFAQLNKLRIASQLRAVRGKFFDMQFERGRILSHGLVKHSDLCRKSAKGGAVRASSITIAPPRQ